MINEEEAVQAATELLALGERQHFFTGVRVVTEQKMGGKPSTEFAGCLMGIASAVIEVRVYALDYIVLKLYRKGITPRTYKFEKGLEEVKQALRNINKLK